MTVVAHTLPTHLRIHMRHANPLVIAGEGMDTESFLDFCLENPDLRIERTADHHIIIMPPTSSETGLFNSKLHIKLGIWNEQHQLGETFDSSTGFQLPNGAHRSPDTAWIRKERWAALTAGEKRRFAPIVPDFVLELRSEGQSLSMLQEKMEEYMAGGAALGWLIDPENRLTFVYRQQEPLQVVAFDTLLSGGAALPGFTLLMTDIFG